MFSFCLQKSNVLTYVMCKRVRWSPLPEVKPKAKSRLKVDLFYKRINQGQMLIIDASGEGYVPEDSGQKSELLRRAGIRPEELPRANS